MLSEKFKIGAGYVLICLIWGSTWLAIKIGLDSLTPVISGGIRFLLASVIVYLFMLIKKINLQTDRLSVKLYLMLAFFSFVIPFGLVYWAEQFVPSGLASIIFAVMPFMVIIFSRISMPQNKIALDQLLGVIVGFLGIVVIFSENITFEFKDFLFGILAILTSATMQAAIAVMIKKHGSHLNPLSMNFVPLLIAGIFMTAFAILFENSSQWKFDSKAIISISYLAFFGTLITFTTYYWLLKRINVVILSLSTFITPIVAVILGWIIAGEILSTQALAGSGMVLIGILFANFSGVKKYFLSKKRFSLK